jgi:hypothetical protein
MILASFNEHYSKAAQLHHYLNHYHFACAFPTKYSTDPHISEANALLKGIL